MNPIKTIVLFVLLSVLQTGTSYAQQDTTVNSALERMTLAAVTGDVHGLMRYMSPRLIDVMGGKESAFTLINEANAKLKNYGIKIDSTINYNQFAVFDIDEVSYKYIPQLIIMSIPDTAKKMISVTSLLAIKEGEPSSWTFIDTSNLNETSMEILLPEFEKSTFPKLVDKPLVIPKEEVSEAIAYLMDLIDQLFTESEKIKDRP